MAETGGVTLDGFSERSLLVRKFRRHATDDRLTTDVNLNGVIPFGGEYAVLRTWDFTGAFGLATVDLRSAGLRNIDLDPLRFPGKWARIEWLAADGAHGTGVGYDSAVPLVKLVLTRADGAAVETGIAGDVWRHAAAGKFGRTTLTGSDGGVLLRRTLGMAADAEPDRRPKRFRYYLTGRGSGAAAGIDFRELSPDLPNPCLKAAPTRRLLRDLVRRLEPGAKVALRLPEIALCDDAGHLERPNKVTLAHTGWDDAFEFYTWANRQLAKTGGALVLRFPGDDVSARNFAEVPERFTDLD